VTKFLLLYSGGSMPETEEEQAAVMDAWTAWYTDLGAAVADPGNPFTPMAKSVAPDGTVNDGPAGSMASGYTVITADSLDEAAGRAQGCPVLAGGGSVSVFETFEVM
jgi:hypothetical protein